MREISAALAIACILCAACGRQPIDRSKDTPIVDERVDLVFPADGDVIGGRGVLLVAQAEDIRTSRFDPVFEVSADGEQFVSVSREEAPDYGPGSFSTLLDTSQFRAGPLWLRVVNGAQSAGPIQVRNNLLPVARCFTEAGGPTLTIDCSSSSDAEGPIARYEFYFGDGTNEIGPSPIANHTYTDRTDRDLRVAVFDNDGMFVHWEAAILFEGDGDPVVAKKTTCGCNQMIIHATDGQKSKLRDHRRRKTPGGLELEPAPLGKDPKFPSLNFEVEVQLTDKSDAAQCEEGQLVRATYQVEGEPEQHKRACSTGRMLASCTADKDCDKRTCDGGGANGESCDGFLVDPQDGTSIPRTVICIRQGGTCKVEQAGKCMEYPFGKAGDPRGNDDFRKHFEGINVAKFVTPEGGGPRWFDPPGLPVADFAKGVSYKADFLAFMKGPDGECKCHFEVEVDWVADADGNPSNGKVPGHRVGGTSGLKLKPPPDETTANCSQD